MSKKIYLFITIVSLIAYIYLSGANYQNYIPSINISNNSTPQNYFTNETTNTKQYRVLEENTMLGFISMLYSRKRDVWGGTKPFRIGYITADEKKDIVDYINLHYNCGGTKDIEYMVGVADLQSKITLGKCNSIT